MKLVLFSAHPLHEGKQYNIILEQIPTYAQTTYYNVLMQCCSRKEETKRESKGERERGKEEEGGR